MARKITLDGIITVLEELRKRGHVEWKDREQKQCFVMWRTPAEWGKIIYNWVESCRLINTVCTFYELTKGDDTEGTAITLIISVLCRLWAANTHALHIGCRYCRHTYPSPPDSHVQATFGALSPPEGNASLAAIGYPTNTLLVGVF
ncbi:hypothetical protein ScPMuIL_016889 [Solemya velum]